MDNNVLTKMMGLKECEIRRFGFTFFGCVPGRVFVRDTSLPEEERRTVEITGCRAVCLVVRRCSAPPVR